MRFKHKMSKLTLNKYEQKPDLFFNLINAKVYNSIYTVSFYLKGKRIFSLPRTISIVPWVFKNVSFLESVLAPTVFEEEPNTLASNDFFCKKTSKGELLFFAFCGEKNALINLESMKINLLENVPLAVNSNLSMQKLNEVYVKELKQFYHEVCYIAEHKIWSQLELSEGSLSQKPTLEELENYFPWDQALLSDKNPLTKLKETVFIPYPEIKISLDSVWNEQEKKEVIELLKIYEEQGLNQTKLSEIKDLHKEIKEQLMIGFNENTGLVPYQNFNEIFLKRYTESNEELLYLFHNMFTKDTNSFFSTYRSQFPVLSNDKINDKNLLYALLKYVDSRWIYYKIYSELKKDSI